MMRALLVGLAGLLALALGGCTAATPSSPGAQPADAAATASPQAPVTATSSPGPREPAGSSRPGASWTGFWGPHRNARVDAALDLSGDPELREVWRRPIGGGYSEVAVAGDVGYTLYVEDGTDYLCAFDLATGAERWRAPMAETRKGTGGSKDGPISTPVIDGDRLFALDGNGRLFAFDRADGSPLWRRNLTEELGAQIPIWGIATTPLPVGDRLIVQVNGADAHTLVALDPAGGELLWTTHPSDATGYASPILVTLGGAHQVVAATADTVFAVDPEDGRLLWSHESMGEPRRSPVALPPGDDGRDRLWLASYDQSGLLALTPPTGDDGAWAVETVWSKPYLKSTYSPAIYDDGRLVGLNGAYLMTVDARDGAAGWRHKVYDGTLIAVGDHLAILGEKSGVFRLGTANGEGFREIVTHQAFAPGAQSMTGPMWVDGRFLLRNHEEMVLLEVVP